MSAAFYPHKSYETYLLWSTRMLVSVVWASTMIFGLYIFIYYFIGALKGEILSWNKVLPNLYDPDHRAATIGIGAHFAAGGLILILGCIQLIESVRKKHPIIHRWLGRLYVILSLFTALGGLFFIFSKGTVGGLSMDIGFTGYGILTFSAAIATIHYARKMEFDLHRAWAIRLFALAIGSWLYRMDYGFWFLLADGIGHNSSFNGPFDHFMNFFFYIPNLIVAEIFIGRMKITHTRTARIFGITSMILASLFLIVATYYFTTKLWWPAIIKVITEI